MYKILFLVFFPLILAFPFISIIKSYYHYKIYKERNNEWGIKYIRYIDLSMRLNIYVFIFLFPSIPDQIPEDDVKDYNHLRIFKNLQLITIVFVPILIITSAFLSK